MLCANRCLFDRVGVICRLGKPGAECFFYNLAIKMMLLSGMSTSVSDFS
jgi:hypothetical protein